MKHEKQERRQSSRYQIQGKLIARIRTPDNMFFGQIINISRGGMAINALDKDPWTDDSVEVDIITDHVSLTALSCKFVWQCNAETDPSYQAQKGWVCGIQFDSLSERQIKQLDILIRHYAYKPKPALAIPLPDASLSGHNA